MRDAIGQVFTVSDVVAHVSRYGSIVSLRARLVTQTDPRNDLLALDGGRLTVRPWNVVLVPVTAEELALSEGQ